MYSSVGPDVLQDLHYLAVVRGGSWGPGAQPESIVLKYSCNAMWFGPVLSQHLWQLST